MDNNNQNGIDAETRLIGVEDINWDSLGQNENTSFTDGGGTERPLRKINASHVPLPAFARSVCGGADNVADGMIHLSEMASSENQNNESMTEDTSISIAASANMDEKMALLNLQKKNLGGHTLSLIFQEAIDQTFDDSFLVRGFYNGTILINLNGNVISDTANIGALFLFQDCHCKIELKNGTLKHSLSYYAVQAERCPSIYLSSLNFIGTGGNGSCAFYGINSDGFASECLFNTDTPSKIQGIFADYQDRALNTHNTSENPHDGRFELSGSIQSHNTNETAHYNLMNTHNVSETAHDNRFQAVNTSIQTTNATVQTINSTVTDARNRGVLGAYMPSVSDNADFSSYRDGHYFFAGQAAHNYVNNPISNPGFLLSFRYDVHTLQLVFDHAVRELYVRGSTNNSTWQAWRKVLFTDSSVPTPDSDATGNEIVNAAWVASYIWDRFEHSVTSGWAKHNAAVLNWGTGGTSTTTKIVFPHAYQFADYVVLVTPHGASSTTGANNQCVVGEKTTTGCTIYSNNAGVAFNYFAIGV